MAGIGRCNAVSVIVESTDNTSLVVARAGRENFSSEELNVVRSLANALSMAERMLEVRDTERAAREHGEEQSRRRQTVEANYRSLVERLPAIVYSAELAGAGAGPTSARRSRRFWASPPQEWMSDPQRWLQQLHPEDRERALAQENERRAPATATRHPSTTGY